MSDEHFKAFFALLEADPTLNPYDGVVPDAPAARYSLVYFTTETPGADAAPEVTDLTFDSDVIDAWAYIHSVGATPASARIQSARVRTAVLNQRLTVAGRECFPIRWREGQPPRRDEDVPGAPVYDQVDAYSWRSVPG